MPTATRPLRDRRPLTILLRDRILTIITEQGLAAGDRVPTEAQLARDFGVGRTTVRESLKLLEQDGYITSRHGVGRFISTPPSLVRPLNRLEGVTDMLAAHGLTAEATVVSHEAVRPDDAITETLDVPGDGGLVQRLVRSRGNRSHVLVYSIDYFIDPAPEQGVGQFDGTGSLFEHLASVGVEIVSATCDLSAELLDTETAQLLGTDPGQPWLLMVQQHLTNDGRPVLYSRDFHRGPDFSFRIVRTR